MTSIDRNGITPQKCLIPDANLFPQCAFEYLAGGVARQVVYEEDVFGTFEVCQFFSSVFLQSFAQVLRFGIFFGDDHGAYGFDPLLVGKAYDGNLGDRLMVEEDFLYFASRDLDAAGVDNVFDPVHDVEVALIVEVAEVPGMEPAALAGQPSRVPAREERRRRNSCRKRQPFRLFRAPVPTMHSRPD
jgi:hypothetical protein